MYRYWDLHWNEPGGKGIFDVYVLYAFTLTVVRIRSPGTLFYRSSSCYWLSNLLVAVFSIGGIKLMYDSKLVFLCLSELVSCHCCVKISLFSPVYMMCPQNCWMVYNL